MVEVQKDHPSQWSDQTFWKQHVRRAEASRPGEVLSSHVQLARAEEEIEALRHSGIDAHIEPGARPYKPHERRAVESLGFRFPTARWNVVRGTKRVPLSPFGARRPARVRPYQRRT